MIQRELDKARVQLSLLILKIVSYGRCARNRLEVIFLVLVCQTAQKVDFHQSLDQHCLPTTTDLQSQDRQPMTTSFGSGQGHTNVGDSGE